MVESVEALPMPRVWRKRENSYLLVFNVVHFSFQFLFRRRFRNKVNSRYTRLRRGLYQKFLESEISQMEKDRQDMTDNLNFSVFSAIEV